MNKRKLGSKGIILGAVVLLIGGSALSSGTINIPNSEYSDLVRYCSSDNAKHINDINDLCRQSGWIDFTPSGPSPRYQHSMFYDSDRNMVVLFGGLEDQYFNPQTWEWNGVDWRLCSNSAPNGRSQHATAYDSDHGVGVLFGGQPALGETWEYDGQTCTWTQYFTNTQPNHIPEGITDRHNPAMAYDEAYNLTVMFGGWGAKVGFHDNITWGYDAGVHDWTMLAGPNEGAPSPRAWHAMTYDSKRGVVVLFGGGKGSHLNNPTPCDETWEWDGTKWVQCHPDNSPSPRCNHAMVYDSVRGVVVLFGGYDAYGKNGETWEYNGSDWSKVSESGPTPRSAPMAYDSEREVVVLFGGGDPNQVIKADTWEWNGTSWMQRTDDWPPNPPVRSGQVMSYDSQRGKVVFWGGINTVLGPRDTWERDSDSLTWSRCVDSDFASPTNAAMAYDAKNAQSVVFGGQEGMSQYTRKTVLWNGNSWTVASPDNSPSRRADHAMAYDSDNELVVLFGGATGSPLNPILSDETWTWDGSNWEQLNPADNPSPRKGHAMAYHAFRKEIILFGGKDANGLNDETWVWDGSNWELKNPMHKPSTWSGQAMVYYSDGEQGTVILFGGRDVNGENGETWIWNGYDWIMVDDSGPTARSGHAMVYDDKRHVIVLFGGVTNGSYTRETWEFSTDLPNTPVLEIGEVTNAVGIFGVSWEIRNIGSVTATDVSWSISIDGGFIIRPRNDSDIIPTLDPGKVFKKRMFPVGIGLGRIFDIPKITVTATASNANIAEKSVNAKVIGWLILFQ